MPRRFAITVIVLVLLSSSVLPSAHAREQRDWIAPAAASLDTADPGVPAALSEAGISSSAWGRMIGQIQAQQVANGCAECQADTTGFTELRKLTAADGERGDEFGNAVAIWGDTVVIGARYDNVSDNSNQGSAYVFARNQGGLDNWGLVKQLTASDGAANDSFGHSVAIWGDTIVIGAILHTIGGSVYQGAAYVFARNQGGADNWGQAAKLTASDGAADDFYGYSVGVWGDTIIVGACYHDVGGKADQGSAYVYRRNQGGADAWGQVAELTAADGAASDVFGFAVALYDDTVVVGAYYHTVGAELYQGSAYVFQRNQGGVAESWGQAAQLLPADGLMQDFFGLSVAIWGDTVVVGAPSDDTGDNVDQGSAYVFERNQGGADAWGQVTKLSAADGAAGDSFAYSVDIYGDTVIVGAPSKAVGTTLWQGYVYVFQRNVGGAESWGQSAQLTSSDGAENDGVGFSVAIWGDTLIAGASGAEVNLNRMQGAAYLFTAPCTPGTQLKKETAANGAAGDQFGISVSIWGDTLVVGALYHTVGANSRQGSAYVFARNQGGADNWGLVRELAAGDGAASDFFGISVAICGDTLVVGAHSDDGAGLNVNQGSAYVFQRNAGGADNWGQVQKLLAAGGTGGDEFGWSVAIWGDTIVVGAHQDAVGANNQQGSAYVFARNAGGVDNWGQVKQLNGTGGTFWNHFGRSVAIWGDTVVVGAPYVVVGANVDQGAAYVFARNAGGADNWGQVKMLTASDGAEFDHFGYPVAIWGDTVVIGAGDDDVAFPQQGSAYVFARNQGGADNWGEVRQLSASDGATADGFGRSLAVWGDTVLVGADSHLGQGWAYLFERNRGGSENWGQAAAFTSSDIASDDDFGRSVGLWGDNAIVGASYKTEAGGVARGAAYVFGCGGGGGGDVAISKAGEPGLVRRGDVVTYTLTYSSTSGCPSSGVWVTDTLPSGLSYGGVISAAAGWTGSTVAGQTVGWYTPTLDGCTGGSFVFSATVDLLAPVSPDWVVANTAEIQAAGDPTPENNLSQAVAVVQGLEIGKSHYPATVTAGWNLWYYVDVTNTASSAATNVVVTDTLPAGVAAYSVQPDSGGVFDGVSTVVWTIPSIGPGATVRLVIKARTYSTAAGQCLTNLVTADSDQAAPPVSASDVMCVVAGQLARPTATPTATPTPAPPPGTVVTIQKGGPGNAEDTYIYRYQPYRNYWLEPLLKVGYKQQNASLIRFDLSPIPTGATVHEAWLEVYAAGWSGPGSDLTVGAYAISGTVTISQTTWISPELGSEWAAAGADSVLLDRRAVAEDTLTTAGPHLWYRFELTDLVQEWLDGGTANNGVLLRCESCMVMVRLTAPAEQGRDEGERSEEPPPIGPVPIGPIPGSLCPYTFFFASSENADLGLRPRLWVRYQ